MSKKSKIEKKQSKQTRTAQPKQAFVLASPIYYSLIGIMFVVGIILILSATSLYGPGLTSDSVSYISTANNVASGKGFVTFDGSPFLSWPPLYPVILSISSFLGGDVASFARLLNALLFGIVILLTFLVSERFHKSKAFALLSSLIVLSNPALINIAIKAWSEILFISLLLALTIFAQKYKKEFRIRDLVLFGIFTSFACLTRYSGVAVFLAGSVFLILLEKAWVQRIKSVLLYGVISLLPLFAWLLHNKILHGSLTGNRTGAVQNIFTVKWQALKMLGFSMFTVEGDAGAIFLLVILAIAAFAAYLTFTKKDFKKVSFIIILPIFYFLFLIITASLISFDAIADRLLSPILPFAILIFIKVLQIFKNKLPKATGFVVFLPIFLWFVALVTLSNQTIDDAKSNGAGLYNTTLFRESNLVKTLQTNPPDRPIYSNYPDMLYALAHIDARWSPMTDGSKTELSDEVASGETVMLAWFFWERGSVAGLKTFLDVDKLKVLAQYPDGWIGVYSLRDKGAEDDAVVE